MATLNNVEEINTFLEYVKITSFKNSIGDGLGPGGLGPGGLGFR